MTDATGARIRLVAPKLPPDMYGPEGRVLRGLQGGVRRGAGRALPDLWVRGHQVAIGAVEQAGPPPPTRPARGPCAHQVRRRGTARVRSASTRSTRRDTTLHDYAAYTVEDGTLTLTRPWHRSRSEEEKWPRDTQRDHPGGDRHGETKAKVGFLTGAVSSFLAGAYIAFGGLLAIMVPSGVSEETWARSRCSSAARVLARPGPRGHRGLELLTGNMALSRSPRWRAERSGGGSSPISS